MDTIGEQAHKLKPGSKIVTLTKALNSTSLKIIDTKQYAMSWGAATAFVHVRVHDELL
jgi:hypothetical protein